MIIVVTICYAMLAAAAGLCVLRLLRAPSVGERVIAVDLLLHVVVTGIAVGVAAAGATVLLNLLVVTALLGFIATVTVARFLEQRGA